MWGLFTKLNCGVPQRVVTALNIAFDSNAGLRSQQHFKTRIRKESFEIYTIRLRYRQSYTIVLKSVVNLRPPPARSSSRLSRSSFTLHSPEPLLTSRWLTHSSINVASDTDASSPQIARIIPFNIRKLQTPLPCALPTRATGAGCTCSPGNN